MLSNGYFYGLERDRKAWVIKLEKKREMERKRGSMQDRLYITSDGTLVKNTHSLQHHRANEQPNVIPFSQRTRMQKPAGKNCDAEKENRTKGGVEVGVSVTGQS